MFMLYTGKYRVASVLFVLDQLDGLLQIRGAPEPSFPSSFLPFLPSTTGSWSGLWEV